MKYYESPVRVLIVGDLMLDKYTFGNVERISPEAPVPILNFQKSEFRLGGAGNVAANTSALGAETTLLSVIARDALFSEVSRLAEINKVRLLYPPENNASTIVKERFIANTHQVLRVDNEKKIDFIHSEAIFEIFCKNLHEYDVIVLSDYGKGTLRHHNQIITKCNEKGLPILADPKGGNFQIYKGCTSITPNLREFEEIVGKVESRTDLVQKAQEMMRELDLEFLLVTLGADGMMAIMHDDKPIFLNTSAKKVFDVSGAGDTVVATLAAFFNSASKLKEKITLANLAAGLSVSKFGTSIISKEELMEALARNQFKQ